MNSWPQIPLGEVIHHRKEFTVIDDFESYKRCRVQLHAKGIVLRDEISGAEIKTKKQQVCRAGEFLVAEIDAKVGGFGIVPQELDGAIVSSHYFLFEINEKLLDRRFLDFYIRIPAFRDQVSAQGSTNYAAIRPKHVLDYIIPLPPLAEQRRIVARIEALAGKIAEARGLQQQAVEEAEAVIISSGRDIFNTVSASNTELGFWLDKERNGIQTGPFGVQLGTIDFVETGFPVLRIGNIQYGGLELSDLKYVAFQKAKELSRYAVKEGDLLFARMGTVGRCCIVPKQAEGWFINYHIIRVALDQSQILPRYVHWSIKASDHVEKYLNEKIRGATRQGVNSKIVRSLPCRVPPLLEQRRIVAYLDGLQAKVDALKRLLAETQRELEALLPSVLEKAFRGEL